MLEIIRLKVGQNGFCISLSATIAPVRLITNLNTQVSMLYVTHRCNGSSQLCYSSNKVTHSRLLGIQGYLWSIKLQNVNKWENTNFGTYNIDINIVLKKHI